MILICEELTSIFTFYGPMPAQLTPLFIFLVMSFITYLRQQRVEWRLDVFHTLFVLKCGKDVATYFPSSLVTVARKPNKVSGW